MTTKNSVRVEIVFGAMVPSLKDQIGAKLPRRFRGIQLRRWQHDADAITRLVVRGYVSESVARRVRQRIVRSVATAMIV